MIFVPHRKHLRASAAYYRNSVKFYPECSGRVANIRNRPKVSEPFVFLNVNMTRICVLVQRPYCPYVMYLQLRMSLMRIRAKIACGRDANATACVRVFVCKRGKCSFLEGFEIYGLLTFCAVNPARSYIPAFWAVTLRTRWAQFPQFCVNILPRHLCAGQKYHSPMVHIC
jgi:hypothetical protein